MVYFMIRCCSGTASRRAVEAFVGVTVTMHTNVPIGTVLCRAKKVGIPVPGLTYWG